MSDAVGVIRIETTLKNGILAGKAINICGEDFDVMVGQNYITMASSDVRVIWINSLNWANNIPKSESGLQILVRAIKEIEEMYK